MPPITPFRPPASTRRNAGPQFASTPRFLLSQRARSSRDKDDIDIAGEDELSFSTPVASTRSAPRPGTQLGSAPRRKEVIEDSEDDELPQDAAHTNPSTDNIFDEGTPGSPTGFAGEIEAQFDALFGSPVDRSKRRRISLNAETPVAHRAKPWEDHILSSSPERPSSSIDDVHPSPIPHRVMQIGSEHRPQRPATATPQPSTPAVMKSGFRNHPRFMLSATPQISSTQTPSAPATITPASQRRKPAFVIPRSPSPSRAEDDTAPLPTPFSPLSKTLNRRGRRANAPAYLPGGMAADVRSWILDMGTKRENLDNSPNNRPAVAEPPFADPKKYSLIARVRNVRQTALSSSGPLAFVEGQSGSNTGDDQVSESPNILLLGPPRSKPAESSMLSAHVPELRADNLIGVHRGLTWEIYLNERVGCSLPTENLDPNQSQQENHTDTKQWLVGMEWDLIQ
ncbi:hypothetical protein MW887_005985 [Aspergillus wentii]|nr:hypothetical protein MW887_005985 [Aspergillus wentii]